MQPKATVDKLLSQLECQFGVRVVYRSLCTAEGDSLEKETKLATLNTSTFYLKRDPRAIDITVHLPPGLLPPPLFFLYFFVPSVFSFFFRMFNNWYNKKRMEIVGKERQSWIWPHCLYEPNKLEVFEGQHSVPLSPPKFFYVSSLCKPRQV